MWLVGFLLKLFVIMLIKESRKRSGVWFGGLFGDKALYTHSQLRMPLANMRL